MVFYLRFCLFLSGIILAESAPGHKSLFVWSSVRPLLCNPLWAPPLAEPKFLGAPFVLIRTPYSPVYTRHCGVTKHALRRYHTKIKKKLKWNQAGHSAELQHNTRTRCEIYNFRKFSTFEYRNRKGPSVKAEHLGHIFWINPERTAIHFSLTLTLWADAQIKFTSDDFLYILLFKVMVNLLVYNYWK